LSTSSVVVRKILPGRFNPFGHKIRHLVSDDVRHRVQRYETGVWMEIELQVRSRVVSEIADFTREVVASLP